MTPPLPSQYFLTYSLYQRTPLDTAEARKALVRIRFAQSSIDCFCVECKQPSVFLTDLELPSLQPAIAFQVPAKSVEELIQEGSAWLPAGRGSLAQQKVMDFILSEGYFVSEYYCSREHSHLMRFVTQVTASAFEKVGQSPALADIQIGEVSKYRALLGTEYSELARGIGLFAHGVGVGAFVYLRRVFEHQIREARNVAAKNASWDESAFQQARMDGKIQLLKDYLPEFVVENKSLYSILSLGLHELDEKQCLEFFPVLRVAIELILDEKLAKAEKDKKVRATTSALGGILGRAKSSQ